MAQIRIVLARWHRALEPVGRVWASRRRGKSGRLVPSKPWQAVAKGGCLGEARLSSMCDMSTTLPMANLFQNTREVSSRTRRQRQVPNDSQWHFLFFNYPVSLWTSVFKILWWRFLSSLCVKSHLFCFEHPFCYLCLSSDMVRSMCLQVRYNMSFESCTFWGRQKRKHTLAHVPQA